jgi:hypothetical protein
MVGGLRLGLSLSPTDGIHLERERPHNVLLEAR